MTREERHIAVLSRLLENMDVYDSVQPTEERKKAIKAAIQALSQEPKADKPMCDRNICLNNEYNGIGCDECIVNKAEQEPCDDVVSREWLMRKATERFYTTNYFNHISAMIEEAPSVTQKSGKWIETEYHRWRCSVCREKGMSEWDNIHDVRTNFCPDCGADMRGAE